MPIILNCPIIWEKLLNESMLKDLLKHIYFKVSKTEAMNIHLARSTGYYTKCRLHEIILAEQRWKYWRQKSETS